MISPATQRVSGHGGVDTREIINAAGPKCANTPTPAQPPVRRRSDVAIVTREAALAGQTRYEAKVHAVLPLDDPEAEGNGGGVGFDDEVFTQDAPTEPLAKAAAQRLARKALAANPKLIVGDAHITERTWVADNFTDERYGAIRDAYSRDLWVRVGYWSDDTQTYRWVEERWRA